MNRLSAFMEADPEARSPREESVAYKDETFVFREVSDASSIMRIQAPDMVAMRKLFDFFTKIPGVADKPGSRTYVYDDTVIRGAILIAETLVRDEDDKADQLNLLTQLARIARFRGDLFLMLGDAASRAQYGEAVDAPATWLDEGAGPLLETGGKASETEDPTGSS